MPELEIEGIFFEWHDGKYELVYRGREISFEEVCSVFLDNHEFTYEDTRFNYEEQRLIIIGMSNQYRLLAVAYTERSNTIRVITAYEPSKSQIERYRNGY